MWFHFAWKTFFCQNIHFFENWLRFCSKFEFRLIFADTEKETRYISINVYKEKEKREQKCKF